MYPINLNYKMPAEWFEHTRTFIAWPVQASMCYPEDFEAVCLGYAEIIEAIAEFEPVTVVMNPVDADESDPLLARLFRNDRIECLTIKHDDAWLRDNGPTFLVDDQGEVAGVNWHFNAWGGKYAQWDLDNLVAPQILQAVGLKRFDAPLVMEGGSLHVDGEGTLLTTEECLLNPNRNPELTREQIEAELKKFLNIRKVVWLKKGLDGDETDGHVDNIACFAGPGKILIQVCDDPEDENYAITLENLKILGRETDALGRKFEIISIQQPPKLFDKDTRLTLSYLNFYFVNGGIILPIFGGNAGGTDQLAGQALAKLFPERRIRTVNGMAIIREGGNVHCTTQQMPAG
ncbi:putative agmatine deiminase [Candidatus Desulfosporosinus infrequens]|uniref:Putative agmatine deiminase n=1 Tax=Candidatus Desulfosporosinus infrequens TaxID=2043169 RepID=A0A2U3KXL7_9FIRM|nr:putative agmatine deiminase [Candidatus Desulfosporosinus infrequens]